MKSWKIGAVSGLIAGIVGGIFSIFDALFKINMGLGFWSIQTITITAIKNIAFVNITINIIWWTIAGLIYVKIYDLIPGKGILKGLIYFLGFYLIWCVRFASYDFYYNRITGAIAWLIPIYVFIISGLAFGASYEYLSEKYSITKYKSKTDKNGLSKGIYIGALAGLVHGVVVFTYMFLFYNPREYPSITADIGFLIGQLGTHLFINLTWGALFGILFVRFYERIPSKGILKGLIFGMVIYFFTTFLTGLYSLAYGQIVWFIASILAGLGFVAFGIVIGYLYKPRK